MKMMAQRLHLCLNETARVLNLFVDCRASFLTRYQFFSAFIRLFENSGYVINTMYLSEIPNIPEIFKR